MATAKASSGIRNDVLLPDAVREYIVEHKLEKVVTSALNCVIQSMPEDPYARLAEELSKSSISAPRFVALRPDSSVPRRLLQFYVVVATRGVNIRILKISFGNVLFPTHGEAPQARDEEKMVAFLQDFFARSFNDVYVDDFLSIDDKCSGLTAQVSDDENVGLQATLAMTNQLLDAGAAAMNLGILTFLQHVLVKSGCDSASPPLRTSSDLASWRRRWPRLAIPVLQGGGPSVVPCASLRCCLAVSPMALASEGQLPFGWVTSVFEALKLAKAEVTKSLQADKATAALVVDGVAHALPGGLAPTLQLARKAMETALGGASESFQAHGLLIADGEQAWRDEEGVYEVETGKQKSLEELVEFYAALAEDGWLTTIVNPFREADAEVGADMLRARRPDLKLVQDYGAVVPELTEETAFSCFWHLPQTLPAVMRQYAEQASAWQEVADGFGYCVHLDTQAAINMPAILEALLACADVQVIYLAEELREDAIAQISKRQDEVLYRIRMTDEGS